MLGASSTKVMCECFLLARCCDAFSPSRARQAGSVLFLALRLASWSACRRVAPRSVTVAPRATTASRLRGARACKTLGAKLLGTFAFTSGRRRTFRTRSEARPSVLRSHPKAVAAKPPLAADGGPGDRIAELRVQDVEGDYQRSKPHDERAQEQHDDGDGPAPPGACPWLLATRPSL